MKKLIEIIALSSAFLFTSASVALAQGNVVNVKPNIAPDITIEGLISAVINLLFVVAAVVAIVFLIWGGIRWILSGGDKSAVEAARNTIIAAIIGLVIVFLSFFILTVVFNFLGIPLLTNFKLPSANAPNIIGP